MSKKIRLKKTAMFQDSEGDCLCIACGANFGVIGTYNELPIASDKFCPNCGAEAVRKIKVESLMDVCEVIE